VCGETKDDIEIIDGVLQLNMQLISDDNGQLLFVHHAGVVQVRILEGPDKRGPSLFRSVVACSRGAAAKGHAGRTIPSADGPRRRRHCSESAVRRFFGSPSRCCCRVRPALSSVPGKAREKTARKSKRCDSAQEKTSSAALPEVAQWRGPELEREVHDKTTGQWWR